MSDWADAYLKRISELKIQHVNHIVGGSVADYVEYNHLRGTIQGLSIAEREFKDILSQTEGD